MQGSVHRRNYQCNFCIVSCLTYTRGSQHEVCDIDSNVIIIALSRVHKWAYFHVVNATSAE